jgi:hypothetical protein
MLVGFPLLLIPLAIFNIVIFLMPGMSFSTTLFAVPLRSGASWSVTLSDLLLALGIFLLLLEVMKARRPGAKYFTDHFLSLVVFSAAAAEFVMLPQFATSTFFLLTLIALVDFLGGLALLPRRPRRVAAAPAPVPTPVHVEPAPEPRFTPAGAPVVPAAAPVAEAEQKPFVPASAAPEVVVVQEPSAPATSPGLQPGSDAHPPAGTPRVN